MLTTETIPSWLPQPATIIVDNDPRVNAALSTERVSLEEPKLAPRQLTSRHVTGIVTAACQSHRDQHRAELESRRV
jgi:hypothetical protein